MLFWSWAMGACWTHRHTSVTLYGPVSFMTKTPIYQLVGGSRHLRLWAHKSSGHIPELRDVRLQMAFQVSGPRTSLRNQVRNARPSHFVPVLATLSLQRSTSTSPVSYEGCHQNAYLSGNPDKLHVSFIPEPQHPKAPLNVAPGPKPQI